jgi:hypothetical protein
MEKPFGVSCVTAVLSEPRNNFVVLLNVSRRLSYVPLGFGYVFEKKIAVHVAKIADNLRLRSAELGATPANTVLVQCRLHRK